MAVLHCWICADEPVLVLRVHAIERREGHEVRVVAWTCPVCGASYPRGHADARALRRRGANP